MYQKTKVEVGVGRLNEMEGRCLQTTSYGEGTVEYLEVAGITKYRKTQGMIILLCALLTLWPWKWTFK